MRIQHNILAMNAYRNYNTNTSALAKNLEKLSSGYKINRAGDDAAGLAISEKMRAQITGLNAAQKNVKDGISLVKTGEGAMQEIQDMLNRMDYLATQSANGTYDNEVDRANLQKEVDALKEEINRIADSANFNGIKLLDGKAGINNAAFTFESVSAQGAVSGGPITINFTTNTTAPDYHLTEDGVSSQAPEFSINLDTLKLDATGVTANATVAVTINIDGTDVVIGVTGAAGTAGVYSAASIASAIVTAFNKEAVSGTASQGGKLGDYIFRAAVDGNGVKFTLVGKATTAGGNTYKTYGKDDLTAADVTALNALSGLSGGSVTVTAHADVVKSGEFNHQVDDVKQAIAEEAGQRAGITFEFTADMLNTNNVFTIDGVTFNVLTDPTDTAAAASTDIDLRKFTNATTAEKIAEAVNQMSQKTTTNFDIEKADGTHLHIDQLSTSTKKYDNDSKLKAVVGLKANDTNAVNAGTKVTVDSSKVNDGDKLTIGDKTFVFTTDSNKVGSDEVQVNGKDNAALLAAINGDGTYDAAIENGGVVVRAKATATDKSAPVVAGAGLMLQIGDTSDSYNRLAVKIGDMHTKALGIDALDISNPEGAANAIQTIRSAINQVSGVRGDLGAIQNRLEHTANNLSVMAENIQDAESTIRDTDVAEEMMAYTKNNILVQSAQAMLAQANAVPQGVLQLLG